MEAHNLHHSDNSEVDSDFEEEAEYEHTVQQATAHLAAQRSVQYEHTVQQATAHLAAQRSVQINS